MSRGLGIRGWGLGVAAESPAFWIYSALRLDQTRFLTENRAQCGSLSKNLYLMHLKSAVYGSPIAIKFSISSKVLISKVAQPLIPNIFLKSDPLFSRIHDNSQYPHVLVEIVSWLALGHLHPNHDY
jgi:hypothetical protein